MKIKILNTKEIRRQIIASGYNSVAEWGRENQIPRTSLVLQMAGIRPASTQLLKALKKSKIKIKTKEIKPNGMDTRATRHDSIPAHAGTKTEPNPIKAKPRKRRIQLDIQTNDVSLRGTAL